MKTILISTTLLLFGCTSQVTIKEVVGTYSNNSQMSWHSLILNSDSTFEYKYSYDLGGERDPINGKFYIVDDKIIINSSVIPALVNVKESVVLEDSITLIILDRDSILIKNHYPLIRINDWKSKINMTLPILLSGFWKVGINSQIAPIRAIQFTFGNYPVEYHPNNPMANHFVFQFNISGKDFFRESFFVNEPFLFNDGRIYPLGPTRDEYNMDYPMRKVVNNK